MMKEKKDYTNMDLEQELILAADQLVEDLTESVARLSLRLKKQTVALQAVKEMRKG